MKKHLLFLSLLFIAFISSAQEVIRQQSCSNPAIEQQADSLRQLFAKEGYDVLREASMTMESEYEMPVIVPLEERSLYQVVFIGEMSSKMYELRMYDYDEKMVSYQKKMWGDVDGNIISFSYSPQFSELHMIKPVQVNKKRKKNLCGYIMLLKKVRQ